MSELIKQLYKKGDNTTLVFPNIKGDNIPSNAITTDKINDNAVTESKINDNAVTSNKINNNAVTTDKINDNAVTENKIVDGSVKTAKIGNNAVTTAKIQNGAVTNDKLGDGSVKAQNLYVDLYEMLLRTNYTYLIYMGDSDDKYYFLYGSTTLSSDIHDYTEEDLDSALDFDKASASDYTTTDLQILKDIIDGINTKSIHNYDFSMISCDNKYYKFGLDGSGNYQIYFYDSGVQFELKFDSSLNILNYTNNKYVYVDLFRLINPNVHYPE